MLKKRICCILLSLLSACCIPADTLPAAAVTVCAVTSGSCGENLTYTLDKETLTLTISGTGAMDNWTLQDHPDWTHPAVFYDVIIEDGVTTIGDYAFANTFCRHITIPDSVTEIGSCAFQNSQLEEITIPDSVTKLGEGAFCGENCLRFITIPDSVTELPPACFAGCTWLLSVQLPENLTAIPERCFDYCAHMVEINLPDSLTEIGDDAFRYCCEYWLTKLPDSLQNLGAHAFQGCMYDTSLTFPPSLDTIGEESLPEVLSLVREIIVSPSGYLYSINYSGDTIVFPENVATIPASVLAIQRDFNTLVILPTVRQIDDNAFSTLPSLKTVMGIRGTAAETYAQRNGLTFLPLDADAGEPVRPEFGTETLSISNTSDNFGENYPTNDWHTAVLREAEGGRQLEFKGDSQWKGSCFGLAAFQALLSTGTVSPAVFGAETAAEIQPTPDVISFINCLHLSNKLPVTTLPTGNQTKDTAQQTLLRIISLSRSVNEGQEPFLLQIRTPGNGLHEITCYGLEAGTWEWNGESFDSRILLWDSNYTEGGDRIQLYYNSTDLHWCIPAYQMYYHNDQDASGALLYTLDNLSDSYKYFADRAVPLPGDVNSDAKLSAADAVILSKTISDESTDAIEKKTGILNLDADQNGLLDIDDVLIVLRAAAE
ncbi:MAG: leucine-rich repeat protein [Oscillospiraceae bacterium]|nr:leucine-rich repeat protein [Oscillospiraceae bacterium]